MRRLKPARIIALGFALVILFGSLLLSLPFSIRDGVSLSYADALYTATSAVCVTGLVVVDIADTFTLFGQMVVLLLMQVGGLGVAAVGTGIILAIGRKVDLKGRTLIREAMNLGSDKGTVGFLRYVLLTTLIFEIAGAVLTYPVFAGDYPPLRALFISIFHSVAAFNNSGFDVLGGMRSLTPYSENIMLNIVTMLLITAGGIGFFVIRELWEKRFRWRRLSMHTRVVITVSAVLTFGGALLLCLTEDIPFLGALFSSVSARTAGFSSYPLGGFSNAGLIVMETLMFVGYLSFVGFRPRGLVQGVIFRNRQRFRHGRAFDGYHIGAFAAFENSFNTYHVYWQARSHDDCDALVFFGRRTRILSHGQHFNRMTGGKI